MDHAETRKLLDRIRIVAIVDLLLLIVLVVGMVADWGIAPIVGPIHGAGFVYLLYETARGAADERWGWWFPVITLVTTGPPGGLIGDVKIRRELDARTAGA